VTVDLGAQTRDAVDELLRPSTPAVRPAADDTVPTHVAAGLCDSRLGALSAAVGRLVGDYGRSPRRATSWRLGDNCVVTVLEDFLTPGEQALVESGDARFVRELRSAFVDLIGDEYVRAAEGTLGREVIAHRSQVICGSSICVEIFVLGNQRPGPGASQACRSVPDPQHGRG
jgi:uncharacterized protein YbcI